MNMVQQIGNLVGQVITRLHRIVEAHKGDYGNPHRVTKEQVGLGRVDNTPDEEKPLSEVQREALGNLSTSISAHVSDESIHRTSEQIRADITDADIPPGIARKSEVESALLAKVSREEGKELMPSPPDEPDGRKYLCDDGTWKEISPDSLIFTAIPELPVDGTKGMQGDLNTTFTILDDGAKEECWRRWMNGQRNIEGYLRYFLCGIRYHEDGSIDLSGGLVKYMKLTSCVTEWDMYPKFTAEYYWPYDGLDDFGTFDNVGMFRAVFYFFVSGSGGEVHTGGHSIMRSALADLHWIYPKIEGKVEKEAGKGLSSNDYTDADKARLGQLFDGSMLDSQNPQGYHRHNYLEMSDLPPVIELSAANYAEFKIVLAKLQAEVAKKKFGRIVQTGDFVVDDETVHNLQNVELVRFSGNIKVDSFPLHLAGYCTLKSVIFTCDSRKSMTYEDNKKALVFHVTSYQKLILDVVDFRGCFATGNTPSTPVIEVINTGNEGYIEITKAMIHNNSGIQVGSAGLLITSASSKRLTLMLQQCVSIQNYIGQSSNVTINTNYSSFDTDLFINDGSYITNRSPKNMFLTFNKTGLAGIVPAPATGQATQNFVLCGDGVWRDIHTLV